MRYLNVFDWSTTVLVPNNEDNFHSVRSHIDIGGGVGGDQLKKNIIYCFTIFYHIHMI
jgi:hypothetical protein